MSINILKLNFNEFSKLTKMFIGYKIVEFDTSDFINNYENVKIKLKIRNCLINESEFDNKWCFESVEKIKEYVLNVLINQFDEIKKQKESELDSNFISIFYFKNKIKIKKCNKVLELLNNSEITKFLEIEIENNEFEKTDYYIPELQKLAVGTKLYILNVENIHMETFCDIETYTVSEVKIPEIIKYNINSKNIILNNIQYVFQPISKDKLSYNSAIYKNNYFYTKFDLNDIDKKTELCFGHKNFYIFINYEEAKQFRKEYLKKLFEKLEKKTIEM